MDASWLDRRVYGSEPDDPEPGPQSGHAYVELVGGPLDGMLLDITGWDTDEIVDGALLICQRGQYGPGRRSAYEPAEGHGGDLSRFVWRGDVP
ncbi:hypothetical protein ACIPW5_38595 [Streptomyces sp. NPDC090077]|uniref:hypothetical protein n=1 Tax=Streptomyces sp. NPDC090077 TaxID=3365938 RepID=UPI00380F22DD